MANDSLITKIPTNGDASKIEIGPLISFFTEGINERCLKDHISGRFPTYKGFIYKRVNLEEARSLGFEY